MHARTSSTLGRATFPTCNLSRIRQILFEEYLRRRSKWISNCHQVKFSASFRPRSTRILRSGPGQTVNGIATEAASQQPIEALPSRRSCVVWSKMLERCHRPDEPN